MASEKQIIDQIIREMKTNSGKCAMRNIRHLSPKNILKRKKDLIARFSEYLAAPAMCVVVHDIKIAMKKIKNRLPELQKEYYVIVFDSYTKVKEFSSKKEAMKWAEYILVLNPRADVIITKEI